MTSSIEGGSTNDVSSTHQSSNTSFGHPNGGSLAQVLTQDKIIKECIRQGGYRTPFCNEKLYLHGKGYNDIAQTAFDQYTDVKVLWLEGNGLSRLNIGGSFLQTRPPKQKYGFLQEEESSGEEEKKEEESKASNLHVDPMQGISEKEEAVEPEAPPSLPSIDEVDAEDKDCFSSLYPTVRQLYLHNNIFRFMPDLSRFQQLDSLHLGGNFFTRIEPFCAYWEKEREKHLLPLSEEDRTRVLLVGNRTDAGGATTPPEEGDPPTEGDSVKLVPSSLSAEERERQLEELREKVEQLNQLCLHTPLMVGDDGSLPKTIPLSQRQPCSTLRALNLSNNRIEKFDDYVSLLCYKSLTTLDLSQNNISDGEALLLVLERLPRLKSLKLTGNPLVRNVKRYRQTVLSRCKQLMHLDDRPVFEEERRLVMAWARGGDEGVSRERDLLKQEKEAAQERRLSDFRALLASRRDQPAAQGFIQSVTTDRALQQVSVHPQGDNVHKRFNDRERFSSSTSSETDEEEMNNGGGGMAEGYSSEHNENKPKEVPRETGKERVLSFNSPPAAESTDDIYIPGSA